jgi:hypothetical protein
MNNDGEKIEKSMRITSISNVFKFFILLTKWNFKKNYLFINPLKIISS